MTSQLPDIENWPGKVDQLKTNMNFERTMNIFIYFAIKTSKVV